MKKKPKRKSNSHEYDLGYYDGFIIGFELGEVCALEENKYKVKKKATKK